MLQGRCRAALRSPMAKKNAFVLAGGHSLVPRKKKVAHSLNLILKTKLTISQNVMWGGVMSKCPQHFVR